MCIFHGIYCILHHHTAGKKNTNMLHRQKKTQICCITCMMHSSPPTQVRYNSGMMCIICTFLLFPAAQFYPYISGLLHCHWSRIANMSRRACVLIKQIQSNPTVTGARQSLPKGYQNSINSLATGKSEWNFTYVIFKQVLVIDGWGILVKLP